MGSLSAPIGGSCAHAGAIPFGVDCVSASPVYLDAATAAPLHPVARQALLAALDDGWADPAGSTPQARRARQLLDAAREAAAQTLGVRADEVSFTRQRYGGGARGRPRRPGRAAPGRGGARALGDRALRGAARRRAARGGGRRRQRRCRSTGWAGSTWTRGRTRGPARPGWRWPR